MMLFVELLKVVLLGAAALFATPKVIELMEADQRSQKLSLRRYRARGFN